MKYTLIQNNERILSSNDFDSLVEMADRVGGGFVVETADYEAQQKAIEAHKVHMHSFGLALIGKNLRLLSNRQVRLTNDEFCYLMRHTFLNGQYGSDLDVFDSSRNQYKLFRIANADQQEILKEYLQSF